MDRGGKYYIMLFLEPICYSLSKTVKNGKFYLILVPRDRTVVWSTEGKILYYIFLGTILLLFAENL